jgi:hypothetical protein
MDVLPIAGDRVRVGGGLFEGVVVDAYNEGSGPHVTIEIEMPGAEPDTATFPLRYVEPAPPPPPPY